MRAKAQAIGLRPLEGLWVLVVEDAPDDLHLQGRPGHTALMHPNNGQNNR